MRKGGTSLLITREVDYALRIIRALSSGGRRTTSELCKGELIPQQFAYKILRKLARADFITTTRGIEGGSCLSIDLRERNLLDLIAAMEATEPVNACMTPGHACDWRMSHGGRCAIHTRLALIAQAMDSELRSHSLAALLEEEDAPQIEL